MSSSPTFKAGLEDVVALTSEICFIDGTEGRLLYRGYSIEELAQRATFEEVAFLLWHGRLPSRDELTALRRRLGEDRALPPGVVDLLRRFPPQADTMDVLRTAVSSLALFDPEAEQMSPELNVRRAEQLTARFGTIVATWHRLRQGLEPVAPDPELDTASDFLRMLFGQRPDPSMAKVLDTCLILHADHELNASTFAARVTAGTLADMYAALTSAVAALKGPLHGGANEAVMKMVLEIGEVDRAEAWVLKALSEKRRIMGFGHRVYKNGDPRAAILRRLSEEVGRRAGNLRYYEISRRIEEVVGREKPGLYPNVDFYAASTYYALGIPIDLYTPIFAVSRVSGWTAHILEQYANNRLIRPRAEYTGPTGLTYLPVDAR